MIVDIINKLLEEREMTIEQLEKKVGIKSGSIRNWNKFFPSVDKIQRVAKILDTDPYYIINGEELLEDTIIATTDTGMRKITGKEAEELKRIIIRKE
ncbi:MAG: helix-turn-helix domain-containing protein [Fusobacterium ulcerans]|uniref:helix-turn-helix domain-containing protein n=1 Tax=Fusobacterium ulcerans TaxID=861 RepID=UPI003A87D5B8